MPSKVYGVNLGSWLVLESWMLPQEWLNMGGQSCSDCSTCIADEFSFAEAFPDTVDAIFKTHWETWFNQTDVSTLKNLGINTVRIPLGYWIVEQLVNRQTEFYPRGGLEQLIRGLEQLHAAGIVAILDHHALPGVQTPNQMFTGHCTSDVEFYTSPNYLRALTWAGVMTALSHLHPAFAPVFAIEAVNEPIMDAAQTPGYGAYQENFVTVVRGVEAAVGVKTQGLDSPQTTANASQAILDFASAQSNIRFNSDVKTAMGNAASILEQIASDDNTQFNLKGSGHGQTPLVTNFMDVNWQNDNPPNPAAAAWGPQAYDNHLYYVFGGVAAADPEDYMVSICNLGRVQADAALGDSPLWFGEWGLPTQFDATDMFLQEWADAQKLAYSKGAGWIFWNFKVEHSELAGNLSREWSYIDGVEFGYLTKDPSTVHNTSVCAPFVTSS
ncbi:glycoside hydrolase family 5 protein [Lentinula edodes]|uniref:glycoside hydrolase family 5 protein n=1 Tax=Lentinula edodes TaxID=5353 RepID=UPI001E8CA5BB|nr:glycoside hydrolase family 5 protein [Lentinula edodes]KAH7874015.1 glycoside hydrolase family 5 protein [Lentinula edodes]